MVSHDAKNPLRPIRSNAIHNRRHHQDGDIHVVDLVWIHETTGHAIFNIMTGGHKPFHLCRHSGIRALRSHRRSAAAENDMAAKKVRHILSEIAWRLLREDATD